MQIEPGDAWMSDFSLGVWVLTFALGFLLYVDLRKDITRLAMARNVVLVGLFMWYVLEALKPSATLRAYGSEANHFALLLVSLAVGCFIYGYRAGRLRVFDSIGHRVERLESRQLQWRLLLLAGLAGFVPVLVYGGFNPAMLLDGVLGMRKTWGGPLGRGALGDFRSAVLMLERCAWGASWIAIVFFLDRRNRPGARMFALALVVWTLLRAYGSGTRSLLFFAGLVPAAAIFWTATPRWRRRLIAMVPLLAIAFFGLACAIVTGRDEGGASFADRPVEVGYEMFRELLFIVEYVPGTHPYLLGATYWAELVNPIPRFLWPDKPLGFGIEYAAWHGHDALAGGPNMSPGILGEMYANFGVIGIILCSFAGGVVCRAWDRLRERHANSLPVLMYYTAGLAVLFLWGRSATLAALYPLIAAYLCLVVLTAGQVNARSFTARLRAEARDRRNAGNDLVSLINGSRSAPNSTGWNPPILHVRLARDGDRPRILGWRRAGFGSRKLPVSPWPIDASVARSRFPGGAS